MPYGVTPSYVDTVYRLTVAVTIRDQFTGVTLAARH